MYCVMISVYNFPKVQLQESQNLPKDMVQAHHVELFCSRNYQDQENDPSFLKMLVFPNCEIMHITKYSPV